MDGAYLSSVLPPTFLAGAAPFLLSATFLPFRAWDKFFQYQFYPGSLTCKLRCSCCIFLFILPPGNAPQPLQQEVLVFLLFRCRRRCFFFGFTSGFGSCLGTQPFLGFLARSILPKIFEFRCFTLPQPLPSSTIGVAGGATLGFFSSYRFRLC